ncbi:MAG: endonuclease domain-containing protein [Polaromonas sp.]|uniref:endonuclease domain-containing protein n=1 Tax=Polaromonas sp. TaxID=1869339 RepID=UPI002726408A|nr:endonuclease domain-containing protein [Polaromonas sp.]MDO9112976.1 endonuclease domain-containing protein [Polaromonas sp.]MDP1885175.1 endonuclease domain-containing protein [Polaromonas sp.]
MALQASDLSDPLSRARERVGVRVRARALRKGLTDAEALLWSRLRARQLGNFKFRRQHPVSRYFADFVCIEIGLVIELDGGQHAEDATVRHDQKRSDDMAALGFQTLRFWNNDVLLQTEAVLEKILQVAETLTPTLSRKREREETGATRSHTADLTPTLSRKREREQDKDIKGNTP